MSDNPWRVEAPALNGLFPGVNRMIICDCGNQTFEIGSEVDLVGNKYIRYVECAGCGKQTRTQRTQVQFSGVSNMMICDCSCQTFRIGTWVDLVGKKHVRCIECADCGKQTAVSLIST
jgi:hypothetical protein